MARYAIIKNDEILNVVLWDGVSSFNHGYEGAELVEVPSFVGNYDKKIDGKWHRKQKDENGDDVWVNLEPELNIMAAPKATKKKK